MQSRIAGVLENILQVGLNFRCSVCVSVCETTYFFNILNACFYFSQIRFSLLLHYTLVFTPMLHLITGAPKDISRMHTAPMIYYTCFYHDLSIFVVLTQETEFRDIYHCSSFLMIHNKLNTGCWLKTIPIFILQCCKSEV
jgi:hypothetical protein